MLLPSGAPLPSLGARGFSVLSLNVLIPNSVDGWWIYKMYPPGTADAVTSWPARQALLRTTLRAADADVVTLQETSADSFASDFDFMREAGYECALLAKGRMRPATFWKARRFARCLPDGALAAPEAEAEAGLPTALAGAHSKDRSLITCLRLLDDDGAVLAGRPPVYIINVHLTAGPEAARRLRQVHEALETVRKLRAKAGVAAEPAAPCVVAGDFNSQGRSAVCELLCAGEVRPDFRESGDPTEHNQAETAVTTKVKAQSVGAFADAAAEAYAAAGAPRPPTMVAARLQERMVDDDGAPTAELRAAVDECFDKLSADGEALTAEEEARWLVAINRETGRGSESRAAAKREGERLTRADFARVYAEEVGAGKFWGVEHDLHVLRGAGLARPDDAPFTAVFDYVYYTRDVLKLEGALEAVEPAELAATRSLPNARHASDHLPVGVALAFADA